MSSINVPAGKYILSDPCYVVPHDLWRPLLNSCDYFNEPTGNITKNGINYNVYAFDTAYGDGTYTSSVGHELNVDSGLIGLTPYELAESNCSLNIEDNSVEFTEPTECFSKEGVIYFGHISVDTNFEEDLDEDLEECEYHE